MFIKIANFKLDYFYGINKKGKRFIIINVDKERFLIFENIEDIFEFIDKNKFPQDNYIKAINYANKIFRNKEDLFIEKFFNNKTKNIDYIT